MIPFAGCEGFASIFDVDGLRRFYFTAVPHVALVVGEDFSAARHQYLIAMLFCAALRTGYLPKQSRDRMIDRLRTGFVFAAEVDRGIEGRMRSGENSIRLQEENGDETGESDSVHVDAP